MYTTGGTLLISMYEILRHAGGEVLSGTHFSEQNDMHKLRSRGGHSGNMNPRGHVLCSLLDSAGLGQTGQSRHRSKCCCSGCLPIFGCQAKDKRNTMHAPRKQGTVRGKTGGTKMLTRQPEKAVPLVRKFGAGWCFSFHASFLFSAHLPFCCPKSTSTWQFHTRPL